MRHALSDTYGHANTDFNADRNGHVYGYSDGYGYTYCCWNSNTYAYADMR